MEAINKIMKIMDSIKYGYIDKNGINIFENNDNIGLEFSKKYRLMSPDDLFNKKCGVCWDQVELERKLFEDINIKVATYFIYIDEKTKLPSHTFLVYNQNNKFYWFEHSWYIEKGIHEYKFLNDLLNDVEKKFIQSNKEELIEKEYTSYIYKYKKPTFNISCDEFYEFIYKQEKIYNYKLSKANEKDINRIKQYKLKSIIEYANNLTNDEKNKINSYINTNVPKQINNYKNIIYNTKTIGSILINKEEKEILLDEIYIEKKYRHKGIGSSIIKTLIENSKEDIYLWVYKENTNAYNLYLKIGFKVIQETESRFKMKYKTGLNK